MAESGERSVLTLVPYAYTAICRLQRASERKKNLIFHFYDAVYIIGKKEKKKENKF